MKKYLFESYTAIFHPSIDYFKLRHDLLFFILLMVTLSHGHIHPVLDAYITTPRKQKRLKKGILGNFLDG